MRQWIQMLYRYFRGPNSQKDSVWGWVVVFAGLIINMCTCGFQMTFGLIYPSILRDLKPSKGQAAFVSSLMTTMVFLMAPPASIVSDRIGLRNTVWLGSVCLGLSLFLTSLCHSIESMYITFGLLTGFSAAFVVTPCAPMVNHYFHKRTKIALGILAAGIPFSSVALTPIFAYILKLYGWRTLTRVLSVSMSLALILVGASFVPTVDELQHRAEISLMGNKGKLNKYKRLLTTPHSLFLLIFMAINVLAANTFNVHMVELCLEYGISWDKASKIPMILGTGSIIGRLLSGAFNSVGCISAVTTYQLENLLLFITCIVGSFANTFQSLACLAFIYMVLDGASLGSQALPLLEISGPELFQQAWALSGGFKSIPLMLPPPIVGWLVDETHDYRYLMYWTAWPCLVTAIAFTVFQFKCLKCMQKSMNDSAAHNFKDKSRFSCEEGILLERETTV